eukprot:TRINITY_DN16040_c1_g2_i1.p1 TRINITY_DN16040_c1_g2~~TRINITY_DN16040_c1_g2_i1.p1  ORF type:complete len:451 (-),score=78.86 TRINITY_DN16040_c1_g2_i1:85-1437(-)
MVGSLPWTLAFCLACLRRSTRLHTGGEQDLGSDADRAESYAGEALRPPSYETALANLTARAEYMRFWATASKTVFFSPNGSADPEQLPHLWDRFASISALCLDFNKVLRVRRKANSNIVATAENGDAVARQVFYGAQAGTLEEQEKGVGPNKMLHAFVFTRLTYIKDLIFLQTLTRAREADKMKTRIVDIGLFSKKDLFSNIAVDSRIPSGFVAYNAEEQEVLVVLQGSYVAATDSVLNVEAWTVEFGAVLDYYYKVIQKRKPPQWTTSQAALRKLRVHRGWAWTAVDLYCQIKEILERDIVGQNRTMKSLVFTGHSLGAALGASLSLWFQFFDACKDWDIDGAPPCDFVVSALLFAQPRGFVQVSAVQKALLTGLETKWLEVANVRDPILLTNAIFKKLGSSVTFERGGFGFVDRLISIVDAHQQDVYKGYIFDQYVLWSKSQGHTLSE